MKKFALLFTGLFSCFFSLLAQAPEKISYQAVIRDSSEELVTDSQIGMRLSILQGDASGTVVYTETHRPTSNINGLITLEIGGGTVVDGDFSAIDWTDGPFFMKTETDPDGGTNYSITGTTQLMSVPYAIYANDAGTANTLKAAPDAELGDMMYYDGANWISQKLSVQATGGNQPVSIMQPYLALNYCIATQGIFPSRSVSEPFLGTIAIFGFDFAPRGWFFCNGQLLAIAENQALFSLLGTRYGGDGRTTFGLPDLQGRTPIHFGQGYALSPYSLGQKGGAETITLIESNLPSHTHTIIYAD